MPWYVLEDCRGWTCTTNNRSTAETMFRRMRNARGKLRLRRVLVDGETVWPEREQLNLLKGEG